MTLTGTIVSIGRHQRDGESIDGLLIEVDKEVLKRGVPLYIEVAVTPVLQPPRTHGANLSSHLRRMFDCLDEVSAQVSKLSQEELAELDRRYKQFQAEAKQRQEID